MRAFNRKVKPKHVTKHKWVQTNYFKEKDESLWWGFMPVARYSKRVHNREFDSVCSWCYCKSKLIKKWEELELIKC